MNYEEVCLERRGGGEISLSCDSKGVSREEGGLSWQCLKGFTRSSAISTFEINQNTLFFMLCLVPLGAKMQIELCENNGKSCAIKGDKNYFFFFSCNGSERHQKFSICTIPNCSLAEHLALAGTEKCS